LNYLNGLNGILRNWRVKMKTNKIKEEREYYILAGDKGIMKLIKEKDLNLSPTYFMVIKENSKIGRLIKKEALKRLQ
jgi:hypothetical protein